MIRFYIDGNEVNRTKAKTFYDQHCEKHWIDPEDAAAYWLGKSQDSEHGEECREQINNITESLLEVIRED